jgi:hypothetical protein
MQLIHQQHGFLHSQQRAAESVTWGLHHQLTNVQNDNRTMLTLARA